MTDKPTINRTTEELTPIKQLSPEAIYNTMFAWGSPILFTAVESGLFELLHEKGWLTANNIKREMGWRHPNYIDLLDWLHASEYLNRGSANGVTRYSNSSMSTAFLVKGRTMYIGGIAWLAKREYSFWLDLEKGLKSGKKLNEGGDHTESFKAIYEARDGMTSQERIEAFAMAMNGLQKFNFITVSNMKEIWEGTELHVDVGGGSGLLGQMISSNQRIRSINIDNEKLSDLNWFQSQELGVGELVSFEPGDIFEMQTYLSVNGGKVTMTMANIVSSFDEVKSLKLVQRAYDSLRSGDRLILQENLIQDDRKGTPFEFGFSLLMLVEADGGRCMTFSESQQLLSKAGFVDIEVVPVMGPNNLIIGTKP